MCISRNYLTGFSKRKQERKRIAQEKIIEDLKEEKKRIKLKKRQELNEKWEKLNLKLDFERIVTPKVYDLQEQTVTVTDVSEVDFASAGAFKLGTNVGNTEDSEDEAEEKVKPAACNSDSAASDSDDSDGEEGTAKKKGDTKKKKSKGKHHKNLTHLMSKNKQAKVRRKRKLESKLPSNMRTRESRRKPKKQRNRKG